VTDFSYREHAPMPALTDDLTPLRATVLWLAVRSTAIDGRSCREYTISDPAGADLLVARAFTWSREIVIAQPDGTPLLSILRSRAFVLNGRAHVLELPSKRVLGSVSRNGTFREPAGAVRGRFCDARSVRARAREGLLAGAVDALLVGDGESVSSGPDTLLLKVGEHVRGTLAYTTLPSALPAEAPPRSTASKLWHTVIPQRARERWRSFTAPRGWKFVRFDPADDDPRLELAATLFAAELSRW
jgi:hypothetical protein